MEFGEWRTLEDGEGGAMRFAALGVRQGGATDVGWLVRYAATNPTTDFVIADLRSEGCVLTTADGHQYCPAWDSSWAHGLFLAPDELRLGEIPFSAPPGVTPQKWELRLANGHGPDSAEWSLLGASSDGPDRVPGLCQFSPCTEFQTLPAYDGELQVRVAAMSLVSRKEAWQVALEVINTSSETFRDTILDDAVLIDSHSMQHAPDLTAAFGGPNFPYDLMLEPDESIVGTVEFDDTDDWCPVCLQLALQSSRGWTVRRWSLPAM